MRESKRILPVLLTGAFIITIWAADWTAAGSPDFSASVMRPGIKTVSAMLKYILPEGKIHPDYPGDRAQLQSLFSPDFAAFSNARLAECNFKIDSIDSSQIPVMRLTEQSQWKLSNKKRVEFVYRGDEFPAKGFKNTNVLYYRYAGKNPFFGSSGEYNTMRYRLADGGTEPVMQRFIFYRWTSDNMGQKIDTYMVALDTYTGLLFPYVKISDWKQIFGVEMPLVYSPLDLFPGFDGNPHPFYEYDPAGYVAADGSIVLYDWYKENTKKPLAEQLAARLPLGKSPYYGRGLDVIAEDTTDYAPVSGVLTIQASYLKNLEVTGHSLGFGLFDADNAQFSVELRSSAVMSESVETACPRILVASCDPVQIKKQETHVFSHPAAVYEFVSETKRVGLELDGNIIKTKGKTAYVCRFKEDAGMPISLTYDRVANVWRDEFGFFELARNQTKELIVPLPNEANKIMELCYTVSWK